LKEVISIQFDHNLYLSEWINQQISWVQNTTEDKQKSEVKSLFYVM
jgi:hypothetical protein